MRTFAAAAAAAAGAVAVVVAALAARNASGEGRTPSQTQPLRAAPTRSDAPDRATGRLALSPPAPRAEATAPSTRLELPDGSYVDALNGATDAPPMRDYWGPFAWSPIVGVERSDAGVDWYRHADGSYSTTQMVLRKDLGRMAAMTRVAHPGAAPVGAAAAPPRGR